MSKNLVQLSKLLSLVLRHQPGYVGIKLDESGWTPIDELIAAINRKGTAIDRSMLDEVVRTNSKQRFAYNDDVTLIRASQGHSVSINLNLQPIKPPALLYHGTAQQFVAAIVNNGLQKQGRQHVHLSENIETATQVGARRGKPVILLVNAAAMHANGHHFFLSKNKVWLTDHVPPAYLQLE